MIAAQIVAPEQARVIEIDEPRPAPNEVLIAVRRAGVCGTDLHIMSGDYFASYPLVPGHEFCGVVQAVGAGVTRFAPGDRVTADPNIACEQCDECARGAFNQCRNLGTIGVTMPGAFAPLVVVPEQNVFALGDLSDEQGAFVEPLACVAWGLKRVQPPQGARALVFGAGPMGCLLFQALLATGVAEVAVADPSVWRLERAAALGATHTLSGSHAELRALAPAGFDLVVDATGIPAVVARAPEYVRPQGTIWVFGVCPIDATVPISPYDIFRRDLRVVGSFALNRTFPESLALLQNGGVRVEPLISHTLPLSEFAHGLALARSAPDRMKVQFVP
ncbi:MAG: zinc-dependent alcohol dehydrogenase family protein [Chloroflexales bacterium]|nr:zinc-dependent alcohol dehydrogenase family protein [Chloroflexales bacterium]